MRTGAIMLRENVALAHLSAKAGSTVLFCHLIPLGVLGADPLGFHRAIPRGFARLTTLGIEFSYLRHGSLASLDGDIGLDLVR
jgi:hypothetical protein